MFFGISLPKKSVVFLLLQRATSDFQVSSSCRSMENFDTFDDFSQQEGFEVRFQAVLPGRIIVFRAQDEEDMMSLKKAGVNAIKKDIFAFMINGISKQNEKVKLISAYSIDGAISSGIRPLGALFHIEVKINNSFIVQYILAELSQKQEKNLSVKRPPIILFTEEERDEANRAFDDAIFSPSVCSTPNMSLDVLAVDRKPTTLMDESFSHAAEVLGQNVQSEKDIKATGAIPKKIKEKTLDMTEDLEGNERGIVQFDSKPSSPRALRMLDELTEAVKGLSANAEDVAKLKLEVQDIENKVKRKVIPDDLFLKKLEQIRDIAASVKVAPKQPSPEVFSSSFACPSSDGQPPFPSSREEEVGAGTKENLVGLSNKNSDVNYKDKKSVTFDGIDDRDHHDGLHQDGAWGPTSSSSLPKRDLNHRNKDDNLKRRIDFDPKPMHNRPLITESVNNLTYNNNGCDPFNAMKHDNLQKPNNNLFHKKHAISPI